MWSQGDDQPYKDWVAVHDTLRDSDRQVILRRLVGLRPRPLFSIVLLPAEDIAAADARRVIASVQGQLYPDWELLAPADQLGPDANDDHRLRRLGETSGAAALFDEAVGAARGAFVVPLPCDTLLAEAALYELAVAAGRPGEADILYSDEDRCDRAGDRVAPRFKTAWDPEVAQERDALGLIAAYRTSRLRRVLASAGASSDSVSFLAELSHRAAFDAAAHAIRHVPAVLCHRLGAAPPAAAANGGRPRTFRPAPQPAPLVSVIILTRDRAELVEQCVDGLLNRTDYPALEILVVDNDSREEATRNLFERLGRDHDVRVVPHPGAFNFSALNNRAARIARGEILLLLNNDVDVIHPEWLAEMVSHAIRPDVGAVGAKLLYADGRIQHAGVVLGPGRNLVHQLRGAARDDPGPFGELVITRTVSAVTAACMAVRKSVFFEAGCFDENLRIAFNDIDFCMRLGDSGYRVVWTPHAELFHLESASRGEDTGSEKHSRSVRELDYFCRVWGSLIDRDPFHNPNVVYGWENTTLSAPPRRARPWMTI